MPEAAFRQSWYKVLHYKRHDKCDLFLILKISKCQNKKCVEYLDEMGSQTEAEFAL